MMSRQESPPYPATQDYMDRAVFNITNNGHRIDDYYSDGTGEVVFSSTSQRDDFLRRGITAAEYLDEVQRTALVHSIRDRLPEGEMSASVATAIEAVLDRLQVYSRDEVSQLDTTDEERYELMRGERDLFAALTGIVNALDLGVEPQNTVAASE